MIDEVYENAPSVLEAIGDLTWTNATVKSLFVGYEDHGLLTMSIIFEGECWCQGFHHRNLRKGNAFRNYVEGWLKIGPIENVKGKFVRIGRSGDTFNSDIVAVRPIIDDSPVFWPGEKPDRFYVFDFEGEVMEPGRL